MNDTRKGGKGLLYGNQKTPTGMVQHLCVAPWFLGTLSAHTGSFLAEKQKPQIWRPRIPQETCTYDGTHFSPL